MDPTTKLGFLEGLFLPFPPQLRRASTAPGPCPRALPELLDGE